MHFCDRVLRISDSANRRLQISNRGAYGCSKVQLLPKFPPNWGSSAPNFFWKKIFRRGQFSNRLTFSGAPLPRRHCFYQRRTKTKGAHRHCRGRCLNVVVVGSKEMTSKNVHLYTIFTRTVHLLNYCAAVLTRHNVGLNGQSVEN